MSLLKPVTPEDAKRVWVSIPNPSARRVAKALTQSGRRVHHSTVARWRAQDWRPVAHSLHPLEAARQSLDMAAGVLTGDPVAGLKVLGDEDGKQQELEGLSDRELLREASREMLIASRLVFEVLPSQLPSLVLTKATETATLLNALTAGLRAAVDGLVQFHHLPGTGGSCCERQQRRSTAANPSN
jgi:hypothetical protein